MHPYQHDLSIVKQCVVDLLDERNITDYGGHTELRPVIPTMIYLGGIAKNIDLTLTNRENTKFRMLLGRTPIHGDCIVDPKGSYLCGKPEAMGLNKGMTT